VVKEEEDKKTLRRLLYLVPLGFRIHCILRDECEAIKSVGFVLGQLGSLDHRIQCLFTRENRINVADICLGFDLRNELGSDLLVVQFLPIDALEEGVCLDITAILLGGSQALIRIAGQELRCQSTVRKRLKTREKRGEQFFTPVRSDCASAEMYAGKRSSPLRIFWYMMLMFCE